MFPTLSTELSQDINNNFVDIMWKKNVKKYQTKSKFGSTFKYRSLSLPAL